MVIFLTIFAFSFIGFFIHLYMDPKPRTPFQIAELFLLYQLVFNVGLISLLAFIGFTFLPEYVAAFSGWPACPFEQQMANVNLGYSVLGFLCIWKRDDFWLATIIGSSVWLIADGFQHIVHAVYRNNHAPGNAGVPLYTDILIPVILLGAYAVYKHLKNKEEKLNSNS